MKPYKPNLTLSDRDRLLLIDERTGRIEELLIGTDQQTGLVTRVSRLETFKNRVEGFWYGLKHSVEATAKIVGAVAGIVGVILAGLRFLKFVKG